MNRPILIGLGVVAFLVICGCLVYRGIFSNEELASKPEWSVVQAVASQDRDKPGGEIEFVKIAEYSLVGIPVHDSRKEIWIMLNPRNPPYYKQIPKGSYTLTKEDLKKVLAFGVVISTVENCLESHVLLPDSHGPTTDPPSQPAGYPVRPK
jgi:hypothetical protein